MTGYFGEPNSNERVEDSIERCNTLVQVEKECICEGTQVKIEDNDNDDNVNLNEKMFEEHRQDGTQISIINTYLDIKQEEDFQIGEIKQEEYDDDYDDGGGVIGAFLEDDDDDDDDEHLIDQDNHSEHHNRGIMPENTSDHGLKVRKFQSG